MRNTLPRQRLADLLLGRSVLEFIAEHRANDTPYRVIAAAMRDATNGELDISDVTVRAWWIATPEGQAEQRRKKKATPLTDAA